MVESVCRMQIEGDLEVVLLEIAHEFLRIRKDRPVPCPACPSSSAGISIMPVHIYDEHIKRYVECMELVYEVAEFLVGICPVTGPPVAECKTGRQRHLAGKEGEVLEGSLIVMTVRHEIPVLALSLRSFLNPCPVFIIIEEITFRVIYQSPSFRGDQSVLKFAGLALLHIRYPILSLYGSVKAVESTECAAEIAFGLRSGFPREGRIQSFGRNYHEIVGIERAAALSVFEGHL